MRWIAAMSRSLVVLQHLVDRQLRRRDRQRRVVGDGAREVDHVSFSSSSEHHAVDQADALRLRRVDPRPVYRIMRACAGPTRSTSLRTIRTHRRCPAAPPECRTGCPSAAMRRSACIAIARPPPRQKPRMRAIIGLGNARAWRAPRWSAGRIPAARRRWSAFFSNWLISAPETNALLPAPVRITTRTALSSLELVQDLAQPVPHLHRHRVALFRLVEDDQPDAVILRRQHLAAGVFAGAAAAIMLSISDHSLAAHLGDLLRRVADRRAAPRRCAPASGVGSGPPWKSRDVDRGGDHVLVANRRDVHRRAPCRRCCTCGSANTLSIVLIGPQGMPAPSNSSIQCSAGFVCVTSPIAALIAVRSSLRPFWVFQPSRVSHRACRSPRRTAPTAGRSWRRC